MAAPYTMSTIAYSDDKGIWRPTSAGAAEMIVLVHFRCPPVSRTRTLAGETVHQADRCFPPLCVLTSNRAKKTQQLVVRASSVHSWSQRKWKETLYPMSMSPQLTKRSDALYDGYRTLIGIPLQRAITMLLVQLGCCSYCCSRGLQFDCL